MKVIDMPNFLAYYGTKLITAVKSLWFATLHAGANVVKLVTSVIYEWSLNAGVFFPGKPCYPNIMFASKARSLAMSGVPERWYTRVGSARLQWPARKKNSSLLRIFVDYGRKKFCNIRTDVLNFLSSSLTLQTFKIVCPCQDFPA